MRKKKTEGPGRPPGAIGKKLGFGRDERYNSFRCSQGFKETLAKLVEEGKYKSQADALHDAVDMLARRKLQSDFYWLNKIQ